MAKIKLVAQENVSQLSLASIPKTSYGDFSDDIEQTKFHTRVVKNMLLYSLVCISLLRETYTRDGRKSSSTACTMVSTTASTSSSWHHEHGTSTWFYGTNNSLLGRDLSSSTLYCSNIMTQWWCHDNSTGTPSKIQVFV